VSYLKRRDPSTGQFASAFRLPELPFDEQLEGELRAVPAVIARNGNIIHSCVSETGAEARGVIDDFCWSVVFFIFLFLSLSFSFSFFHFFFLLF